MSDRLTGDGLEKALRWLGWGLAGLFGLWVVLKVLGLLGWVVKLILSLVGFILNPWILLALAAGYFVYWNSTKGGRTRRRTGVTTDIEEIERLEAEEEVRRELEVPVRRK